MYRYRNITYQFTCIFSGGGKRRECACRSPVAVHRFLSDIHNQQQCRSRPRGTPSEDRMQRGDDAEVVAVVFSQSLLSLSLPSSRETGEVRTSVRVCACMRDTRSSKWTLTKVVCVSRSVSAGVPASLECAVLVERETCEHITSPRTLVSSDGGPRTMEDYKFLFKVVLVGNAGVGKTCLVRRFTQVCRWDLFPFPLSRMVKIRGEPPRELVAKREVPSWDLFIFSTRGIHAFPGRVESSLIIHPADDVIYICGTLPHSLSQSICLWCIYIWCIVVSVNIILLSLSKTF